jgi:hypothetical protein
MEYPAKTACCLLPSHISFKEMDEVKSQMLQGQRPKACNKCWTLEDAGVKSDRQIKNDTTVNLEQTIDDCRQGKNKIIYYKIATSNTCNAACVTCNGGASSTWNKTLKKNNLPEMIKDWKILPEQTADWVDYANAESIIITGGESFLSDTNLYILEQLIAHNNTDCHVSFVTNGSFKLSKHQKEILLKFQYLDFCFSIDGIGSVFEYIRWPLKWEDTKNNISWCQSQNISIGISYTLSNINLLYHSATTQWFKDHNINYLVNPVYSPAYFRPQSLSMDAKQQISQQHKGDDISQWLAHSSNDDQLFEEFQIQIAKQDSMKNISMRDYLPEFVELLKW